MAHTLKVSLWQTECGNCNTRTSDYEPKCGNCGIAWHFVMANYRMNDTIEQMAERIYGMFGDRFTFIGFGSANETGEIMVEELYDPDVLVQERFQVVSRHEARSTPQS